MSGTTDLLPMPPASGQVIDFFPRQDGDGGLGTGTGGGVGAGEGAYTPPPLSPPAPPASPVLDQDAFRASWEQRWLARQGVPMVAPQPAAMGPDMPGPATGPMQGPPADPAGFDAIRSPTEPRRGSLRLTMDGSPQTRRDGITQGPPAPEPLGPPAPQRPVGAQLLSQVAGTWMAASQGLSETSLETAQVVNDPEITRRLAILRG